MTPKTLVRYPIAALILVGCSTAEADTALFTPTVDTLPTGVVQVHNPGPTVWEGMDHWQWVEERSISHPEGSPGELSYANALVADELGNVFAMEREPAVIKMFGPDGEWVRNIGREGDGPGEFRSGQLGIRGDTLVVQDANNRRLSIFGTDGSFINSYASQCCVSSSSPLTVLADGRAVVPGMPPTEGQRASASYLTTMSGETTDTVLSYGRFFMAGDEIDDPTVWEVTRRSGNNVSMIVLGVPNQPQDYSDWRPDGVRVSGNGAEYKIALTTLAGDTTLTFSALAPSITITTAERDSLFEEEIAGIDDSWRDAILESADPTDIPTTKPLWSGIGTDPQNRIWISRPDPDGTGRVLDVFSSAGVQLGTVKSPEINVLTGFWVGNRVYVRDTDEFDLPVIRVFRLVEGS